jgi:hypothetical protein
MIRRVVNKYQQIANGQDCVMVLDSIVFCKEFNSWRRMDRKHSGDSSISSAVILAASQFSSLETKNPWP